MNESIPARRRICPQNLRHLRDVPEGVGHVARLLHWSELPGDRVSHEQVPDRRFPADEELVRQHVPGSERQGAAAHQRRDSPGGLGTYLQVVLQDHGLSVQQEVLERLIVLEGVKHLIDDLHQADPEPVVREIPLPVPVSVRDYVGCELLRRHVCLLFGPHGVVRTCPDDRFVART
jgi:hypothetical protein